MLDKKTNTFSDVNTEMVENLGVLTGAFDNLCEDIHKAFISSFRGIPVRIDSELKGYSYHISVSQELYDELKSKSAKIPETLRLQASR